VPDLKRALIIGCGYTGAVLARRLRAAGVALSGTSRGGGELPGLKLRPLDLRAPGRLELPEAEGAVVYYMVSTLFRRHDPRSRPHLRPLEAVLEALSVGDPRGLIYLSSTSVYGDRGGAWVDEHTPATPASPWGQMRADLERRVWAFGAERGVPACVVRLPEIYGPGRGPVSRLRQGYTVRYPERFSNRIHVEDLALVLHELGQLLEPRLLLVADGTPATTAEVYDHAARLLGLEAAPRGEPDPVADPNRLGLLRESKRCDVTLLRRWLDRPLRYPSYREGLPTTL
jgi:nucleoside-diphosphate-sugar epimerase